MRVQLAFPVFRAFDSSGDPLAGGKLYTYDTGTTTPRATYDNDGAANANPVILDANGEAEVWLDNGLYRLVLHNSDDVLQWTIDSVTGIVAPASAAETKTGTDDTLAVTPAGLTLEVIDDRAFAADAEASDTYAITLSPAPAALYTGMTIRFSANTANTGACTLNVNSLGAKAIKKNHDQDTVTGDIESGQIVTVIYDGTNFQMQSQLGNTASDLFISDTAYDGTTWDAVTTIAPSKNAVRDEIENIKDGTTGVALPRSYLAGLQLSNDTDADHDIAIAVGECRNDGDDGDIILSSILTKQIDAIWAVGDDAGGLDTGAVANSTEYHVYAIYDPTNDITDALFTVTYGSPTMPTNYTKKRILGSVYTDGSANILAFSQFSDEFLWADPPLDVDVVNQDTTAVTRTLTVATGIKVRAIINIVTESAFAFPGPYISSLDVNDEASSYSAAPLCTLGELSGSDDIAGTMIIRTNTSGQIRTVAGTAGVELKIATLGWIDRRGKDD